MCEGNVPSLRSLDDTNSCGEVLSVLPCGSGAHLELGMKEKALIGDSKSSLRSCGETERVQIHYQTDVTTSEYVLFHYRSCIYYCKRVIICGVFIFASPAFPDFQKY